MENLLYDIHLAEAEVESGYDVFRDSTRKARLFQSVFDKYRVTEAKFDTSLTWYASHLDIYVAMYDRISKRFNVLNDTLNARIGRQNELEAKAKRIWQEEKIAVLRPFISENRYTFHIDTCSYFAYGDMYELSGHALGVNKLYQPKVTFCWEAKDSVIVRHYTLKDNGTFTFYLKTPPGLQTKSLSGSIRVPMDAGGNTRLILDNLYLYKYKEGNHPETNEDLELPHDSILQVDPSAFVPKDTSLLQRKRPNRNVQ